MSVDTSYEANIDEAVELTSNALLHTPSYVEMFRGTDEQRLYVMKYFMRKNFDMINSKNPEAIHFIVGEDGELDCFFMLTTNAKAHPTWWDKLAFLVIPFVCGFDSVWRLLQMEKVSSAHHKEAMEGYSEYLCLQRMAVTPSKQGQGIGTRHLKQALRDTADKLQLPVMLSTQEKRNVVFYERL